MPLVFFNAHDGNKTCEYDGIALHSKYNPVKEAETFVKNITCDFIPKAVIITEPALSYCADFLRARFGGALLCTVRFRGDRGFSATDCKWDRVFYLVDSAAKDERLASEIFDFLGEEILCATLFLSWQPSAKIFKPESDAAWKGIKNATEKARSVLFTRGFFSARWILNSVAFCCNVKKICGVHKGDAPVVIAASGPSLEASFGALKKNRDSFFLIAVSSAVTSCLRHSVVPDLCLTTDGGWWAERHFDFFKNVSCVAMPPEAAFPSALYENTNILPLGYGDGLSDELLRKCGFSCAKAERNGTVSGTAAMFALALTSGKVFFCGLDLSLSKKFQHAMPNALDTLNCAADNFLRTKETRITASRFSSSSSLDIYRAWFSSLPENISERIFRVYGKELFTSHLGKIQDINTASFEEMIKSGGGTLPVVYDKKIPYAHQERLQIIRKFIDSNCNSTRWLHEFFPAEFISINRTINDDDKKNMQDILNERNKKLCDRIWRLIK